MFFSVDVLSVLDGKMSTMSIFIGFYANHGYFVEVEENFRYKKSSQITPCHSTTSPQVPNISCPAL